MGKTINRKEFLKTTAVAGVGTTILPSLAFQKVKQKMESALGLLVQVYEGSGFCGWLLNMIM